MAKFLKFKVLNTGAAATEGDHLVNVDQISNVTYNVGTGNLQIVLTAPAGGNSQAAGISVRVINALVGTTTTGAGAVPTITNGSAAPDKAVYRALTANPGGVVATVSLGLDEAATPIQMYFQTFAAATVDDI